MTAAANAQTIERFYQAFSRLDGPAMAACYASDASFDDEAFSLRGRRQVGGMWRMLCDATRAKGADVWRLTWRDVHADDTSGRAHWDAHYRFSATGRLVDNSVDSRFSFTPDGLIAAQRDSFAFWTWSRQVRRQTSAPLARVASHSMRHMPPTWRRPRSEKASSSNAASLA